MARTNWDAIAVAFCDGIMTNVQLARAHGLTEGAIRAKAKRYGWVRGQPYVPLPKIVPLPEAKAVIVRAPRPEPVALVSAHAPLPDLPAPAPCVLPEGITPTERCSLLAARMLDELDASTLQIGEMESLIEDETANDKDGRRRLAMLRAISLPTRAATLKTLVSALNDASGTGKAALKLGKKDQLQERAHTAGKGKFSVVR